MSGALEVAMVGMRAQQRALDVLAGNISNINTPAYKRVDVRFAELVGVVADDTTARSVRRGADTVAVAGVMPWTVLSLDSQGRIDATGNQLDLAIDGQGFIEVLGPGGQTLLWRGGTLRIMEDGALASAAGYVLKAEITLPPDATAIRIDRAGQVFTSQAAATSETQLGKIDLLKMGDSGAVERLDGGVFAIIDSASAITGSPGEDGLGSIVQAALERSNVDLNAEMIGLLIAQRAYAANAQVARAADEFHGIANGLRR